MAVTIPDSVTSIEDGAFSGCNRLVTVIMQPSVPPTLGRYMFSYTSALLVIKVPQANFAAYTTDNSVSGWEDYKDIVVAQN